MKLLQNMLDTLQFSVEGLKSKYSGLVVQQGLPMNAPSGLMIALEYDKSKVDTQHELAGYRRRPRVFFADIYGSTLKERNYLCEEVKDLFENQNIKVLNESKEDTGVVMASEGARIEVDHTQKNKARAKIYFYTFV